jgi:hypothetical protein
VRRVNIPDTYGSRPGFNSVSVSRTALPAHVPKGHRSPGYAGVVARLGAQHLVRRAERMATTDQPTRVRPRAGLAPHGRPSRAHARSREGRHDGRRAAQGYEAPARLSDEGK